MIHDEHAMQNCVMDARFAMIYPSGSRAPPFDKVRMAIRDAGHGREVVLSISFIKRTPVYPKDNRLLLTVGKSYPFMGGQGIQSDQNC